MNSRKRWQQIRDAYEANTRQLLGKNCLVNYDQLYVYGDLAVEYDMETDTHLIYKEALLKPDGKYGLTAVNYVRAFLNLSREQFGVRGGKLFLSEKLVDIKLV